MSLHHASSFVIDSVQRLKDFALASYQNGLYQGLNLKSCVATLSVGGAVYVVYRLLKPSRPSLPNLDYQFWWGPDERKNANDTSIRPFRIVFTDELIKDLRRRIADWRKPPPPLEGVGFTYGFNTKYLQEVMDFWRDSYDFKERENFLNQFPQYKTQIQGLDIHFIHVKSSNVGSRSVVPLLLMHGWPGSVREFYELIPLLTDGEGRDFVFEVVVPSLPGYGFSEATSKPGLGSVEMAVIMRNLMHRIGHETFYVQGGDWGAVIGGNMSTLFPNEVLGLHSNMMRVASKMNNLKWLLGSYWPSAVVDEECRDRLYPISKIFAWAMEEFGYMHIQATKPDTVGVALSDSPSGLAAYILEKFSTWTDTSFKSLDDGGLTNKYPLVHLLDNLMLYWTTNSITTSVRLYAESTSRRHASYKMEEIQTTVPTWVLKTKHELFFHPDGFIRHKFVNLLGSTVLPHGGHFPAFEMPDLLSEDIFSAIQKFISFRKDGKGCGFVFSKPVA